jgi:hypothetical protein
MKEVIIIIVIAFSISGLMFFGNYKSEEKIKYEVTLMDGEVMKCSKVSSYKDHTTTLTFKDHSKIIVPTNNIKVIKILDK